MVRNVLIVGFFESILMVCAMIISAEWVVANAKWILPLLLTSLLLTYFWPWISQKLRPKSEKTAGPMCRFQFGFRDPYVRKLNARFSLYGFPSGSNEAKMFRVGVKNTSSAPLKGVRVICKTGESPKSSQSLMDNAIPSTQTIQPGDIGFLILFAAHYL